ncbi:regulatory iron-sulfur-containing complex subunit RicT [Nemorincola caseinilytica]
MGCGNCSTGANGKPGGCKGNGGCSTGGCNRMNVFDWLKSMPLHDGAKPYTIVEMSFSKGSRKEFFRNNTNQILEKGEWLAVEGTGGFDVGQVSLTGELVKLQMKKYGVKENDVTKRILHTATEEELAASVKNKDREPEVLIRSRAIAKTLNLDMKLCEVEMQADGKKGTFFYTADQRVDFRELIRVFATDFKLKVEMRQIGARQESGKVGGIGSCGRELCCSTWLTDFRSVNTTAARYQNLSINQAKLSGQCGRLKCCLNYELDTYMDALSVFPDQADSLDTANGIAHLQKKDIFKNLMWYSFPGNNKQYPLTITRVKEIIKLNKEGKKADELHPVELEARDARGSLKTADMGFVNDVGQITLKNLEKNKKKKKKGNEKGGSKGDVPAQQAKGQLQGGNKPQQNKGQQKPQGQSRPQGEKPQGDRPQGERPQGGQQGNRPQGEKRDQQQRPQGQPRPQQQQGPRPPRDGQQQGEGNNNKPRENRPQQNRPPRPPRPNDGGGDNAPAPQPAGN